MTIKSSDSFPQSALDRFANQTDFSPAANLKKQESINSPALTSPVTNIRQPINQNEKADADSINSVGRRLVPLSEENTSPNGSDLNSYQLKNKKGEAYNGDPSTIDENGLYGIKIGIDPEDTSETILQKGFQAAAFPVTQSNSEAQLIAEQTVADMKDKGVSNVDVESGKIGALKDKTEIQNLRRSGTMDFYVTGKTLKRFDRIHAQKLVMDALKRGEMPNDALLARAGADREKLNAALNEVGWQPIPTFDEAVEKLAADKKAQVLAQREKANSSAVIDISYTNSKWYGMTDEQITAETRREAMAEIRRAIGKGELTVRSSNESPSISPNSNPRWKTDVKLFVEKYLPGIADLNTPEGIKTTNAEAFVYGWINARTFGATDFYVDKSRFNNERQANEAWAMQKLGQITGEFQNLRAGGKTVEAIMNTPRVSKAVTALNESGLLGKTLVNTLPSAVTFGGVETMREVVKTATGQSEGIQKAVENITRATTEGAVFGVLQPLPLKAQIPAVAASSYGIAKVFGADNAEAAQTAFLNGIFAIAGGRTNAAKELSGKTIRVTGENGTAANVRLAVEPNGRIRLVELPQTYKANLQVKVSELKEAVQNIGGKLKSSEVVIDAATGQRITVPKRALNEILQDPMFRVKSGEEFRQRYGQEVTYNPKVRERLGEIEKVSDKGEQIRQLQTLEADVLISRVEPAKLPQITKQAQTNQSFMNRCGNVNETLSTNPTAAKREVDGANSRLSKGKVGEYGKPDNIRVDADKKIIEVEEVKFFGLKKLEDLAIIAKSDPRMFVSKQINQSVENGYIQFDKHIKTINAIKNDLTKIDGIEIKGVSENAKYVFTIPKMERADYLRANQAVKEMQKAWKSQLGIDVKVRYSEFSTTDIQQITTRLEQQGNQR